MKSNIELFNEQKYVHIKGAISPDICGIAAQYGVFDSFVNYSPDADQVVGAHRKYADPLMESLLIYALPIVEQNTGLKLFPTYSVYRTYRPGDKLDRHTDRPSCEISVSLCLGYNYEHSDPNYQWGLNVGDKEFFMGVGDMVLYKGPEIEHWREPLEGEQGTWQVQVFLHYVNAEGLYWPLKYDARPYLGLPEKYINYDLRDAANAIHVKNYATPSFFNLVKE